jgi:hypothetical protein
VVYFYGNSHTLLTLYHTNPHFLHIFVNEIKFKFYSLTEASPQIENLQVPSHDRMSPTVPGTPPSSKVLSQQMRHQSAAPDDPVVPHHLGKVQEASSSTSHLKHHHYRHRGKAFSTDPHHGIVSNPHQIPELLESILRDKSQLKIAQSSSLDNEQIEKMSQAAESGSSAAETTKTDAAAAGQGRKILVDQLDVDSFVPPGYDKLMPPKENGKHKLYIFQPL